MRYSCNLCGHFQLHIYHNLHFSLKTISEIIFLLLNLPVNLVDTNRNGGVHAVVWYLTPLLTGLIW